MLQIRSILSGSRKTPKSTMDTSLTAKQIRQMFLDFFIKKVIIALMIDYFTYLNVSV